MDHFEVSGASRRGRWSRWAGAVGHAFVVAFRAVGRTGQRAITSLPWIAGGNSGYSAMTTDRALSLIPFFACVRVLADAVASLPLQSYRQSGQVRQQIPDVELFAQPAARGTLFGWLHQCVVSLALRGNAYGLVVTRDRMGFPTTIQWLNPDDVYVDETNVAFPRYWWMGREVPAEDILHIPWFVLPGHVVGLSPVAAFASSIGVGLSATTFGRDWFQAGGHPPGTFKNSQKTITQDQSEEIKGRLVSAIRSHEPIVYGADWDFNALSVSPEESQFIETMKINATQMAAIFGIDPEEVGGERGGSLTYNNLEQDSARFARRTLRSWLVRLEQEFTALRPPGEYVRFNLDAFVRADLKTRYEAHHMALDDGWMTKDEVRALEDLAPLPNGEGGSTSDGADVARSVAEIAQKVYLGVPGQVIVTADEARDLMNRAGAGFTGPAPVGPPAPAPVMRDLARDPTWDYELPPLVVVDPASRNGHHKPDPALTN